MVNIKIPAIILAAVASSLILSGCTQSLSTVTAPSAPPRALPSTPSDAVISSQLPPLEAGQQQAASLPGENPTGEQDPNLSQQVASNGPKITREGLAGSWQVPTDGLDCRIILAFTKWSGGYRAATRRCVSAEIQSVNAWDVKDQSVVLVDKSGNEIARLFATQAGQYNGRTTSGEAVSFVR